MPPRPGHRSDAARLLLIDDQPDRHGMAGEVARYLVVRPEIMTTLAGRPALDLLRRGPFDLVLVDLASVLDLAALREESVGRLVKAAEGALVVALTDDASVSAAVAVMRAGVHDVVVRPIGMRELTWRLAKLAQRHGRDDLFGSSALLAEMAREAAGLVEASDQIEAIGQLLGWPGDLEQLRHIVQQLSATALASNPGAVPQARRELPGPRPAVLPMWQQEQRIIEEAIASFAGNIALAAAALELSPSTIYRKRQTWAAMEAAKGAA